MNWDLAFTQLLALYGAMLATFTFISNFRKERRRIKVELSVGIPAYHNSAGQPVLTITASNPGHRTVTLTSPGLSFPDGTYGIFPIPQSDVQFPHELTEGRSCLVWTDISDLAQDLKKRGFSGKIKLGGYFRDAVGGIYRSKPMNFDVDEWATHSLNTQNS